MSQIWEALCHPRHVFLLVNEMYTDGLFISTVFLTMCVPDLEHFRIHCYCYCESNHSNLVVGKRTWVYRERPNDTFGKSRWHNFLIQNITLHISPENIFRKQDLLSSKIVLDTRSTTWFTSIEKYSFCLTNFHYVCNLWT